ncbi:MAG: S41 family peptidase [Paludibacter sp.]|nr:S41 family peptidase [Paludibacter sp.]
MKKHIIFLLFAPISLLSCMDEPIKPINTNKGNFEALWNIIDTRYCYLDYKNINWDSIHSVYGQQVTDTTKIFDFFDQMASMLGELKDGHVNLYSNFDRSRYWKWFTDYRPNFNSELIYSPKYLGENYRIASGLRYAKIADDSIGYIYFGSFSNGFSDTNMRYVLNYFSKCKGLIIDVRDNGGGSIDYSKQLASYFFTEETATGYIKHKTGNGHSDFSEPLAIKTPAHKTIQWKRPIAILTNRMSYSATNDFVNRMKQAPNAIVIGDRTGGGGGLPLSSELPNGWMVRFSASPMFDSNLQHTEWGIEPDVKDSLKVTDEAKGIDTIIEKAITILK